MIFDLYLSHFFTSRFDSVSLLGTRYRYTRVRLMFAHIRHIDKLYRMDILGVPVPGRQFTFLLAFKRESSALPVPSGAAAERASATEPEPNQPCPRAPARVHGPFTSAAITGAATAGVGRASNHHRNRHRRKGQTHKSQSHLHLMSSLIMSLIDISTSHPSTRTLLRVRLALVAGHSVL